MNLNIVRLLHVQGSRILCRREDFDLTAVSRLLPGRIYSRLLEYCTKPVCFFENLLAFPISSASTLEAQEISTGLAHSIIIPLRVDQWRTNPICNNPVAKHPIKRRRARAAGLAIEYYE